MASYRETENTATVRKTVDEARALLAQYPGEQQLELAVAEIAMGSLHQRHGDTQRDRFLRR
nr:hypothetical protein [Serratia marcescens]